MSKYNYLRTAKLDLDHKKLNKIEKLVDGNNHPEAYILGAEILGAKNLKEIFKKISEIQNLEGYIPKELKTYREDKVTDLKEFAKKNLSEEDYELFTSVL